MTHQTAQEWVEDFIRHEDGLALMYVDLGERPEIPPEAINQKHHAEAVQRTKGGLRGWLPLSRRTKKRPT